MNYKPLFVILVVALECIIYVCNISAYLQVILYRYSPTEIYLLLVHSLLLHVTNSTLYYYFCLNYQLSFNFSLCTDCSLFTNILSHEH